MINSLAESVVDLKPFPTLVRFGAFELDLRARELRKDGLSTGVPEQSIKILALLLETPGEIVLRDEIRKKLCLDCMRALPTISFAKTLASIAARLLISFSLTCSLPIATSFSRVIRSSVIIGSRRTSLLNSQRPRPSGQD